MCSGTAIGVATAAQSLMAQRTAASAQYQSEMDAYNNAHARWAIEKRQADDAQRMRDANAILQMQQLQTRQQEINEAAAGEKSEIAIAAMRAKAAAELSAGEAGVSGRSVDKMLASIESEASRRTNNVEATRENQVSQAQMDKQNTKQGANGVPIYAVLPDQPTKSSSLGSFLSAAVSGFGAAYPYLNISSTRSTCSTPVASSRCKY